MTRSTAVLLSVAIGLAGCTERKADQDTACQASDLKAPDTCKPGQKVVFLPKTFGNPQVPVLFAGMNCDLSYSVVVTDGAVTCIYRPVKTAVPEKQGGSQGSSKPVEQ
ncbi:hypothetical protein [Inhella proteolytica]|uniref:Lipoprotein n=1 Tax=Inhella proteolytica TaxID=2795029 RepID=A0A931NHU3_9BURK|nr:hypothetical protein [Inhella proteolytica]MBH9578148.1 hypothetical protein [Inhella proteolytica]